MQRIKAKISELLVPGNKGSWPDVRDRLNKLLIGWSAYFSHGTRVPAYRAVHAHVYDRVRNFLRRRHNVSRRGTSRFSLAMCLENLRSRILCARTMDARRGSYGDAGRKA